MTEPRPVSSIVPPSGYADWLARTFHQVAPVYVPYASQNADFLGTSHKAKLDRWGYAGLRGACAALLRSSARQCLRALDCAPLAQHRSHLHPRNSRVPDEISGLSELKTRIHSAQQRAVLAVNRELVLLYWQLGHDILERQSREGWGAKVIDRLARDLREAFPEMKGFSTRNLKYMRYFAEHCPAQQFGQQPAAQLPWFHIVTLLTKLSVSEEREWYAQQAVQAGWSRVTLELHIKNRLFSRQGQAVTNFSARLPSPHSGLAHDTLKDPYLFDFLGLGDEAHEREIENALIRHITRFLLELGTGFAFVGRQHRLEVAGDEFFIDLLFYHVRLKCYVVVELKAVAFKPEHAGQLNFYLAAVDAQIKAPDDKPTIGLLLCWSQNKLVAEYALSGIDKPIGVAEYELVRKLPEQLTTSLPSIEEIEQEMTDLPEAALDDGADAEEKA